MATRYWVGGTGTWSTSSTSNWSASSGGASGASAPTSADDVIFDNSSASTSTYTVTIASGGVSCNTLTFSGTTRTASVISATANTISIAGNNATVFQGGNATQSSVVFGSAVSISLTYSGGVGTRTIAAFIYSAKISVASSSDAITLTGYGANPFQIANLNFASGCTNALSYGNNVTFGVPADNTDLLTLQSGMTLNTSTYSTSFEVGSFTGVSLYTKGKSFGSGGISISITRGTIFIREPLTTTGTFTATGPVANNYPAIGVYADLTCATFSSSGPTSAYITYIFDNNSSIVVTSAGTFTWTRSSSSPRPGSGSTENIKFTSSTGAYTITGGGSPDISRIYIQGGTNTSSVTFGTIGFTPTHYDSIVNERTVAWTAIFTSGLRYALYGELLLNGYNSSNRVSIQSSIAGSQFTFEVQNGYEVPYISLDNVNIRDSNVYTASGYLSPGYAGTNSTNVSNNTNWTFGYYVVSPTKVTGTSALGNESVTTTSGVTVTLTGVQGSGIVDSVSVGTDQIFSVSGVIGITALGTAVAPNNTVIVTGVQAAGEIGILPQTVVFLVGVQGTGQIGFVDVPFVADVFGVQAVGYVADVVVGVAAYPVGVQGTTTLGVVAVWITVNSAQTTNWVPINTLQY